MYDLSVFRPCAALLALLTFAPVGAAAQETGAAAALPAHIESDTVVARVGGIDITLGEVIAFRQTLPEQFQQLNDEVLLESILAQIIDQTVLEQAARRSGLEAKTAFRLALRNQRRAVMADAFMAQTVIDTVTEEAIAALYDERIAGAQPVPEVRTSHILVRDRAEADKIRAELDAGGDFAALAAKHGQDTTASRGGDRGWESFDRMVPAFAEAVQGLEIGQLAGPVQTSFGWHLIRMEARRDRPLPTLVEVKGLLFRELSAKVEEETLQRLRDEAGIEQLTDDVPAAAVRADALIED